MKPRHMVPATKFVILHNPSSTGVEQAADIFGSVGAAVIAPADGRVTWVMDVKPPLAGWQIQGFVKLPDGREMGFVAAHLVKDSYPLRGSTFKKGQVIGKISRWPEHPKSTHVHVAFKQPSSGKVPPPADIPILEAFRMLGPAPQWTETAEDVPEIRGEGLLH